MLITLTPENFCWVQTLVRSFSTFAMILYADVLIILKYIFIFWLQNPTAFQNEFWAIFIGIWVMIFVIVVQFTGFFIIKFKVFGVWCLHRNLHKKRNFS